MRNKDFYNIVRHSLHQTPVPANDEHLAHMLSLSKKEISRRQNRERISYARFLSMQIKYVGWKIWAAQGVFLLIIRSLLTRFYGRDDPKYMMRLLSALSVLVLMTALPLIYRSVRCQMQEVEAATRFSSVKLLMAKLTMIGIGDLFLLGTIFLSALWKSSLRADSVFFTLCFPFLLTGSVCLFLLGHLNARQFFVGSTGFCSLCILFSCVGLRHFENLLCPPLSLGWALTCALLMLFCIRQFRYIMYRSPYAEMQLA